MSWDRALRNARRPTVCCTLLFVAACSRIDERCLDDLQQGGTVWFPDSTERPVPVNAALTMVWVPARAWCNDWPNNAAPITVSIAELDSEELVLEPTDFLPNDGGARRVVLPEWKGDTEYVVTLGVDHYFTFRTSTEVANVPAEAPRPPEGRYVLSREPSGWWGLFEPDNRTSPTGRDFLEIREVGSGALRNIYAPASMDVFGGPVSLFFPIRHERPPKDLCFETRFVNVAGEASEPSAVVCPPHVVR